MRKTTVAALATVLTTTSVALAGTASADKPTFDVVVDRGEASGQFVAGEFCDVPVAWSNSWKTSVKRHFDAAGDFVQGTIHGNETLEYSSEFGSAFKRRAWNGTYDVATDIFTVRGNPQNWHAGAGGVFINDSGRVVLVNSTGEILFQAGQLDAFEDDITDEICDRLEP